MLTNFSQLIYTGGDGIEYLGCWDIKTIVITTTMPSSSELSFHVSTGESCKDAVEAKSFHVSSFSGGKTPTQSEAFAAAHEAFVDGTSIEPKFQSFGSSHGNPKCVDTTALKVKYIQAMRMKDSKNTHCLQSCRGRLSNKVVLWRCLKIAFILWLVSLFKTSWNGREKNRKTLARRLTPSVKRSAISPFGNAALFLPCFTRKRR